MADEAMNNAKPTLRTVCVYCGSGAGQNPAFAEAAHALGKSLAAADVGLVYGGGDLGLMGIVARSVLDHGGHVTGVMPHFLRDRESEPQNTGGAINEANGE